jgi:hypothetical protein
MGAHDLTRQPVLLYHSKTTKAGNQMKKLVKVEEVEGEGLIGLLGKTVTLFCANYIYRGELVGVNDTCVKLDAAQMVYETGDFRSKEWKDCQELGGSWYVKRGAIESFGLLKSDL